MKVEKWALQTVDYYGDENYRDSIAMDLELFDSEVEAIEALERTIRRDWTTEVEVDGEYVPLADLRGQSQEDNVKYSEWNYSEDGRLAWVFYGAGSGHRGEVVSIMIDVDVKVKGAN